MNQAIFREWLFNIFVPSVAKFQDEKGIPKKKGVLLIDNAPSHSSETSLKTLPRNVWLMDQGLISSLK